MGKNYWQKQADRTMERFNRAPASKRYDEDDVRKALSGVQGLTERDIDLVVSDMEEDVRLSEFTRRQLGSGKTEDVRKALADLKQLPIDDETEGSCYEPGEPYSDSFDREMANEPFTEDEKEQMEERLHYSLEELSMNRQHNSKS